jgi:hypothetical protein
MPYIPQSPCSAASVLADWRLSHDYLSPATQPLTKMWVPPPPKSLQGATFFDDLRRVYLSTANCRLLKSCRLSTEFCFDSPDIASARTHRRHRFPHFHYFCLCNCCYTHVAFRVALLRHSLLCRNLLTDVCSD